jgi:hypothetical protein
MCRTRPRTPAVHAAHKRSHTAAMASAALDTSLYARSVDTAAGRCFLLVTWSTTSEHEPFAVSLFHAKSMRIYAGKGL